MITVPELAAEALGSFLAEHMERRFGATDAELIEAIPSAATRFITTLNTRCWLRLLGMTS